jgi:hypothetical protein
MGTQQAMAMEAVVVQIAPIGVFLEFLIFGMNSYMQLSLRTKSVSFINNVIGSNEQIVQ